MHMFFLSVFPSFLDIPRLTKIVEFQYGPFSPISPSRDHDTYLLDVRQPSSAMGVIERR